MSSYSLRMVLIAATAGIWATAPSAAPAQAPGVPPLSATIIPEASSIVVGEPLEVNLILRNNSSEVLVPDLGADRKDGVTVLVRSMNGEEKVGRIVPHGGLSRIGKIRLQPDGIYSQLIIVNDWVDLTAEGTYTIFLRLDNAVTAHSGDSFDIQSPKITITVLARDEAELARFCAESLNRILTSVSYEPALSQAEALSKVHDAVAIPYLKRAFGSRYHLDALFIQSLEAIGTDDAARALADVAQRRVGDPGAVNASLKRLSVKVHDRDLRSRIQAIVEATP
jgi:hypothetical protein